MIEIHTELETGEGRMGTFIVHPDEEGPHPVVLFLMDAPGKREEIHDMAQRIATYGYWVILPNLYYRRVSEFVTDGSLESRKVMFEHMNSLSNEMVVRDCRVLLEHASQSEAAGKGPAGCVGYCMSGPFAFAAAAQLNDRIRASASIHGVRLCTDAPDSPHLDAEKIRGEIYFGCAETDEWAPTEMIESLDRHLSGTGINYRIEWYPHSHHGFVFPLRAGMYHKPSAERHWFRVLSLFQRNLK